MKYIPLRPSITMQAIINSVRQKNGATASEAASFCVEMTKWGYRETNDIPIDDRFIVYATRNDCFIRWLLDKGYIHEKEQEFTIVEDYKNAIKLEDCFFLAKNPDGGITLKMASKNNALWNIAQISPKKGTLELFRGIKEGHRLKVDEKGYIVTEKDHDKEQNTRIYFKRSNQILGIQGSKSRRPK